MVLVISRFKVGNGMEREVREAFANRPRLVEEAAGFLGMEVFTDVEDASVFSLVTRWTDIDAYTAWHESEAFRVSQRGIPAGLKLATGCTEIRQLERLPGPRADAGLEETVANSVSLLTRLLDESRTLHLLVADPNGSVRLYNRAFELSLKQAKAAGASIWRLLTDSDAETLRDRIAKPRKGSQDRLLLNFVGADQTPFTLECYLDVQPAYFVLIGEIPTRGNETSAEQMLHLNNELAVLSRENARKNRELEQTRSELIKTLDELKSSHWHLKKLQEYLPICMECGKVKTGGEWEDVAKYLKANALFLSHGYCPECTGRVMARYGLTPKE